MIDPSTRDKIIERAQILEVVSDFVSLRRSGANYRGLCPFHSDRSPSFYVSPSKNFCKCFSCGEGGSPIHFIMKHEQLSYPEALRYLAKKYHIEIVEREVTNEEREAENERQSLLLVNEFAQHFFHKTLTTGEGEAGVAAAYFRERGIRPETIAKFGLGYAPDQRHALSDEALKKGYSVERLATLGLCNQYEHSDKPIDRFRGRVIFPIRNIGGKYVAFGGRIMGKSDRTAKYINSPESPIYTKSRELYGLYWAKNAITKADKCYLVEGYTDVLSMHQSGLENVVASCGTALTAEQIRLIHRFTEHVTVLYDGDRAGINAALRGINLLLEEGLNIKVVLLPEGEDPDSFAQKHSSTELLTYINESEVDFIQFKINLYRDEMKRDPVKRAELIRDILQSIALIPDTIRRTVYTELSAKELNMPEALLAQEVIKLRNKKATPSSWQRSSTAAPMPTPSPQIARNIEPTPGPALQVTESKPEGRIETQQSERDFLRLIIASGHEPILIPEEDEQTKQSRWIESDLITFAIEELTVNCLLSELSPMTQQIISEAQAQRGRGALSTYFINHINEQIRTYSTDLLSSPYGIDDTDEQNDPTTHFHTQPTEAELEEVNIKRKKRLGQRVSNELNVIQIHMINKDLRQLHSEIEALRQTSTPNAERIREIMAEIMELNQLKHSFAKLLGERTIMK